MENEQRAATGWNVESYRLRISRIIENMDQEAILENAVTVERCVRDVINRPKEGSATSGGRLRIACSQSGFTQKVFADKIGISLSSLTTLMTNRSPVSRPVALAVELVHRFNAEWILTGSASGSWRQHGQ